MEYNFDIFCEIYAYNRDGYNYYCNESIKGLDYYLNEDFNFCEMDFENEELEQIYMILTTAIVLLHIKSVKISSFPNNPDEQDTYIIPIEQLDQLAEDEALFNKYYTIIKEKCPAKFSQESVCSLL